MGAAAPRDPRRRPDGRRRAGQGPPAAQRARVTASRVRVAVTGLGVRTPAGAQPKELWNALLAGRSTARPITSFDTGGWASASPARSPTWTSRRT
ncbi:beta-ketoacyl synthase N-terminal-like domain-containing protein [Nonomuraea rubra]|uniref:beta-ketoacyl synthase N-terminal-like domain-containing protein n=1 Tax=Nonomuraea rubra TaxID=46180 RepID=UPI00360DCDE2